MLVHPDDWPRVRELFEGALALPASERHGYLETACRTNIAIREQVERMLESHQKASGFLEGSSELTSTDTTGAAFEGRRLGPYQLVSHLGAGGMGVVFRALDTRLDRTVAIKLLSTQVVSHSLARERFERSQSGSPTAPSQSPGARDTLLSGVSDAHAPQAVPLKGRLDGTVVVTPVDPPFFNPVITASGEATHLGRFSLVVPHRVNFATAVGEGDFTFKAANGDVVTAHFTGTADTSAPVFAIVEHATITGGTGRFANATGSFTARRSYDPAAQTTTGTFEGTIVF